PPRDRRMAAEPRANQTTVPRPIVLGVTGGVNADVTATSPNVTFERGLLSGIEDVARRREKNHGTKLRQICVREVRRIFTGNNVEIIQSAQLADSGDTIRDRGMSKGSSLGKQQ